jgi:hypothetical protein
VTEIKGNSNNSSGRGGVRSGAGRPRDPLLILPSGQRHALMAGEILANVVDERKVWTRLFNSQDDRVVLNALMFLVSMRDGRPAQQINVTSQSISISADSVRKAREIIAEIRGEISPRLGPGEVKALESSTSDPA